MKKQRYRWKQWNRGESKYTCERNLIGESIKIGVMTSENKLLLL